MIPQYLYRITHDGLCFGLDVDYDVVVGAAPVAKWAVGIGIAWVVHYWRRRGAKVQWMTWPDGEWEGDA